MKRFKNILFVKEQAGENDSALERTVTLAQDNQAGLTVIDVVEQSLGSFSAIPHGYTAQTLQQAIIEERQEQLKHLVAFARKKTEVETQIISGIPYLEITRKVLRDGHDLVVKATCYNGGLKTRLFGGTDLHLLRKCPVPVWLMKATKNAKISKILAAVDIGHEGEEESGNALSLKILELASTQALAEFSELHLVHAWQAAGESLLRSGRGRISANEVDKYVDDEENRHHQWIKGLYQKAIQNLGGDALNYIKPQIHLPKGWAREVIPQLAQDIDIDLAVMGTVARTGIPGFIMGNTAEMILNNLDCSVLAVKPEGFVTPVTLDEG